MKLIKPSYKILNQPSGLQGIYEQIELAGRTCYASTHKIQYQENDTCNGFISTTAKDFVDRMIASQHYAMLEHGTVYLKFEGIVHVFGRGYQGGMKYLNNPYSKVNIEGTTQYVTTNYRVIVENDWLNDLKYLCEPTEFHEKRVTVRFTTDRGVSHEFVRHRVFSFAQESTRYCNYSKDKFGNELTFIMPSWCDMEEGDYGSRGRELVRNRGHKDGTFSCFVDSLRIAEDYYLRLIKDGWVPQQARQILPNALKTELVMTGFVSDWQHLFRLRTNFIAETGKPHPDMANLCDPLYKEFIERGFITGVFITK